MKVLGKIFKVLLYLLVSIAGMALVGYAFFLIHFAIVNTKAKSQLAEKPNLVENGYKFRDLNNNGKLDIYEDSRKDTDARVEDLLSQMTMEEKAGLMFHNMIGAGKDGEVFARPNYLQYNFTSSYNEIVNKKINHFNLLVIPDVASMAKWNNNLQKLAEQTRLGIPVTISTDPRNHYSENPLASLFAGDFSLWPEPIGLGAIGDSLLVYQFAQIANQEYRAVGIRTALHPQIDLATEPRWGRINSTFGEDAELTSKLAAAYIYGFQGLELNSESVSTMTKHFPGGGPQKDGWDAHFRYGKDQEYPGNNFDYHLIPFKAAIAVGTAQMMPYYGIPLGQTSEDVAFGFNKEILTGLLRDELGYTGIICTDWGLISDMKILGITLMESRGWGVDELTTKEKFIKAIEAGVDQFGGENIPEYIVELVNDRRIAESRIDESVWRLLHLKFTLGLFDDPYVDVDNAIRTVGKKEFIEAGKIAQRRSMVLLKNQMEPDSSKILPLNSKLKVWIEGFDEEIAASYSEVVDSLSDADIAIIKLMTPYESGKGLVDRLFNQGALNFKEPELSRIIDIMKTKPTIVCIYLDRPAIIPEIAENAVGIVANFGANDDAILDVVFGRFNPEGKLPFELPSSMEAVEKQFEDVPYDSENPVFPFGFGLKYSTETDSLVINIY